MPHDECDVCHQKFTDTSSGKRSKFAVFGGLPGNTCGHCFEANDFTVKSLDELMVKSMLRRARLGEVDDPANSTTQGS